MELWPFDVVGGFQLADGTTAEALTGLDDHSRHCVSARLMHRERTSKVCEGFSAALRRYGMPDQVLTDNGKVFTGRLFQPPVEVLFDRICRENGIDHILTTPYSPTTTGKIERFHKTMRLELDTWRVFKDLQTAQRARTNGLSTTTSKDRIAHSPTPPRLVASRSVSARFCLRQHRRPTTGFPARWQATESSVSDIRRLMWATETRAAPATSWSRMACSSSGWEAGWSGPRCAPPRESFARRMPRDMPPGARFRNGVTSSFRTTRVKELPKTHRPTLIRRGFP